MSLAAAGAVVLREGITFFYAQATELLQRRRDRHDRRNAEATADGTEPGPGHDGGPGPEPEVAAAALRAPEGVLDGELVDRGVDETALDEEASRLIDLTGRLHGYEQGFRPVTTQDQELLATVDALRLALEHIYGQRITLAGEARPTTGSPLADAAPGAAPTVSVNVSGQGAVGVGGDVSGTITTHAPAPLRSPHEQ